MSKLFYGHSDPTSHSQIGPAHNVVHLSTPTHHRIYGPYRNIKIANITSLASLCIPLNLLIYIWLLRMFSSSFHSLC